MDEAKAVFGGAEVTEDDLLVLRDRSGALTVVRGSSSHKERRGFNAATVLDHGRTKANKLWVGLRVETNDFRVRFVLGRDRLWGMMQDYPGAPVSDFLHTPPRSRLRLFFCTPHVLWQARFPDKPNPWTVEVAA